MKNRVVLISGAVLVALFLIGGYFYKQGSSSQNFIAQENYKYFVRDHSPTFGDEQAKVHIVEFFDPLCGTCQAFYPMVKKLIDTHDGKVKLTLRYAAFHGESSEFAIRLFEAARVQGKYWEALEAAMKTASYWGSHGKENMQVLWNVMRNSGIGLDMEKLRSDMYSKKALEIIKTDMSDVKRLNVQKTPSFFVNGKPLVKFGFEELEELVKSEVDSAY